MSLLLRKVGFNFLCLSQKAPKYGLNLKTLSTLKFSKSLENRNILVSNSLGNDHFLTECKEYLENEGALLTILDLELDSTKRYNQLLNHLKTNPNKYDALYISFEDTIDEKIVNALTKNGSTKCKVISTMSVGYNHINTSKCSEYNIKIGYTPYVLTETVADFTVGLTLSTCRRFLEASNAAKTGEWGNWSPLWMCGKDLYGSNVGIVGMGSIGLAVAKRLLGFNCNVSYVNNSGIEREEAKKLGLKLTTFDDVIQNNDFIIVLCPLTEKTKHLFTINEFKKMKNDSIFINCSRGDIVKQDDLINALKNNEILACGLDVTTPEPLEIDNELFKMNNVMILPHIASSTHKTNYNICIQTAKNIIDVFNNQNTKYLLKENL